MSAPIECIRRFCAAREAGAAPVFASASARVCVTCQEADKAKRLAKLREQKAATQRKVRVLAQHTDHRSAIAKQDRERLQQAVRNLRREVVALRKYVQQVDARSAQQARELRADVTRVERTTTRLSTTPVEAVVRIIPSQQVA